MIHHFKRPNNGWLCVFSVLWLALGLWFIIRFAKAGNFAGAGIMVVYGLSAAGLWFQSRAAAWVLIGFASAGIVFSLFKIGHAPIFRVISPIGWALWAILLLAEFLKERGDGQT